MGSHNLGGNMVGPTALRIIVLAALTWEVARSQMLDRNCFGDEGQQGILSDTFLASPVNNQSKALVYEGERDFSVNLIKALFEKYERESIGENIFISPSSIYHTLMLAYFGSRGETQAELTSALGLASLGKSSVLKTYMFDRAYQAVRENTPGLGYIFKHANKLYFEKDLKLNECLRLALGDQVELVNFKEDPEAARENMNQWVEDNTNGIIKDLVPWTSTAMRRTPSASTLPNTNHSLKSMKREVKPRPPQPSSGSAPPDHCSTLSLRRIIR